MTDKSADRVAPQGRHTQAAATQRYAHLAPDPVKAAAQDVASRISAAMKLGGARGTVVPFRGT